MKNPYDVLGMSADSQPEDLQARYEELKRRYSEERFSEGEAGAEAARNLSELETAWQLIQQDLRRAETTSKYGGEYGLVENKISGGDLDGAQSALDEIATHDGKWHYYQSIIFYKRDWLSESRAQLVIAIKMDPNNAKYQEALRKMDGIIGNAKADPNNMNNGQGAAQDPYYYNSPEQQAAQSANACANCVLCYCCTETCCASMRWC